MIKRIPNFLSISLILWLVGSATAFGLANLTPYQPAGWSDKIVVSKVTGTSTDSSPLYTTDTLFVDWAVINNGNSATGATFFTQLYVDGTLRNTWNTPPPVNPASYTFVADYSIGTLSAGTHTVRVVTDSTGAIAESNEGDNQYTKTISVNTPPGQANLTPYQPAGWSDKIVVSKVTGTTTDSSPLYTTDTLFVDWAVINNGNSATGATFFTQVYVDGTLRNTWNTPPPVNPASYTFVADYSIGTLSAGTHTVRVVTDSTGAIAESNEGDNQYTKTISVSTPPGQANLTPYQPAGWSDKIVVSKVTGTTTDSSPLYTTDTLFVDWAVINNGNSATGATFFTQVYVDETLRNTWNTPPPVNPASYTFVADYSIGTLSAGTHTVRVVTDSTGAIAESNEGDNEYTKTISVSTPPPSPTPSPSPGITSITPPSVVGVPLPQRLPFTINGFNFGNTVTVQASWSTGSNPIPSQYVTRVSSTRIDVTIATDVTPDTWTLRVTNPDGQQSNGGNFTVTGQSPTPTPSSSPSISSITPPSVAGVPLPQRLPFTINGSQLREHSHGAGELEHGIESNSEPVCDQSLLDTHRRYHCH